MGQDRINREEEREMDFQKNQLLTTEIIDISTEGEGIGKVNGYPFFIKDTIIGDQVEIRAIKLKKNYGYGRLEKVITPSPFRVTPSCCFHRQCGGCQIQAMSYEQQLAFKHNKVRNNLLRIGGFEPEELDRIMEPIVGMEEPFRYRNKAQYPIGRDKEGNPVAGFYAGRTHSIIANTECLLGVDENRTILEAILQYMKEYRISAYEEASGKGLVRHVLIRKGFTSGEIMVCLVINPEHMEGRIREKNSKREWLPHQKELIERLAAIRGMTSISVSINCEKTNVIMGTEIHTLWGKERITDTIFVRDVDNCFARTGDGIAFSISPLSFYQVNPVQTEKLYSLALSYAGLSGKESVWDLYCGIGTISLFLSGKASKVYGVEVVPQAIEDAKQNAANNGITNAEFFVGKAEEVLPEFYGRKDAVFHSAGSAEQGRDGMLHPDVIVVDPPRKGCDEMCLDTMLKMAPDRIVYVSCDSATLARDLRILCDGGYELKRIRPVDMFPQTVHVETVVLLSKGVVDKDNFRKVRVDFSLEDMDLTELRGKATYAQVKEYIFNEFGLKVSSLYIAQVKKKCGIETGENHNLPKSEDAKQPQVTPEKEEAIMKAFKHFGVI